MITELFLFVSYSDLNVAVVYYYMYLVLFPQYSSIMTPMLSQRPYQLSPIEGTKAYLNNHTLI